MSWIQVLIDAIIAIIAVASFLYTWANERGRRKKEATLLMLKASFVYTFDPPNQGIELTIANRHEFPITINSIDFGTIRRFMKCAIPCQIKLRPYESFPGFFELDAFYSDVCRSMFIESGKKGKLTNWLHKSWMRMKLKAQRNIRINFRATTNIQENYFSNAIKLPTKELRKYMLT